jgi:hypothetical protein
VANGIEVVRSLDRCDCVSHGFAGQRCPDAAIHFNAFSFATGTRQGIQESKSLSAHCCQHVLDCGGEWDPPKSEVVPES